MRRTWCSRRVNVKQSQVSFSPSAIAIESIIAEHHCNKQAVCVGKNKGTMVVYPLFFTVFDYFDFYLNKTNTIHKRTCAREASGTSILQRYMFPTRATQHTYNLDKPLVSHSFCSFHTGVSSKGSAALAGNALRCHKKWCQQPERRK